MKIAKKGYKKEIEMDTKNILKEKKIKQECKKVYILVLLKYLKISLFKEGKQKPKKYGKNT